MLESLRSTWGRIGIAVLTSVGIVVLAVLFRFPVAIVPALLVAPWVSVFASQETASPPAKRMTLVLVAGGLAVLAGVAVLIFVVGQA